MTSQANEISNYGNSIKIIYYLFINFFILLIIFIPPSYKIYRTTRNDIICIATSKVVSDFILTSLTLLHESNFEYS